MTSQLYLILKRGLYYRPDGAGYTGLKSEAGRYSLSDAMALTHPNGHGYTRDGMSFVHEREAPEFSPECCTSVKVRALTDERDRLAAELSEVKRQRQSAWEALAQEEEIARLRADLAAEKALADRNTSALTEANDLLRSVSQVLGRVILLEEMNGVLANWDALHDQINIHLRRHHKTTNEARAAYRKARGL